MSPPVSHCLDTNLLVYAFSKASRDAAKTDAAVIAGARRLGASLLVSEDLAHGQDYGGVRVFNPFASV